MGKPSQSSDRSCSGALSRHIVHRVAVYSGHGSAANYDNVLPKMAKQDFKRLLEFRKMSMPIREMKLRSGRGQSIRYYLDANKSVREQACYRIRIEGNKVSARLMKLA